MNPTFRRFAPHILLFSTLFLFVFIPLFPKIPLFDAIPGYLVRVRLEDVLVLLTGAFWLVLAKKGLIVWKNEMLSLVIFYAGTGLLSILSGVILLQTIPFQPLHLGKSFLHFFRYLEYFSLFFFAASSIRTQKHIAYVIGLLATTILVVTIYGYGQLNWHWPLFSTMNRESSKGERLYLTEFARVQSTFAGHYDMAAFLALSLPILLGVTLFINKKWQQALLSAVQIAGLWLLIESDSKTAFFAFIIGEATVLLLWLILKPKLLRLVTITAATLTGVFVLTATSLYFFSPQFLKQSLETTQTSSFVSKVPGLPILLRATHSLLYPVQNPVVDQKRPIDVYHDIPDIVKVATISAKGEVSHILVERERTWSPNAIKYGLSMAIRLDALWPQAIKGFTKNVVLGSGYGTLNKNGKQEFTEADGTDNNYLRTLGETGLLGFFIFFGIIARSVFVAFHSFRKKTGLVAGLSIGFIGGTVALLFDALVIDVFVASKVAFTYWMMAGTVTAAANLEQSHPSSQWDRGVIDTLTKNLYRHWPLISAFTLCLFLLHKNPVQEYSTILNLTASGDATDAVTTVRCWLNHDTWQLCRDGLFAPSQASIPYGMLLVPFLKFSENSGLFYYLNVSIALSSLLLLYKIANKLLFKKWLVALALCTTGLLLWLNQTYAIPVATNLALPALLGFWLLMLEKRKSVAWRITVIATLLIAGSNLPNNFSEAAHLAIPFVAIGTIYISQILVRLRRLKNYPFISVFSISFLLMLFIFSETTRTAWQQLILEYRGEVQTWRLQTVRRANQFFDGLAFDTNYDTNRSLPRLITATNPYFFDWYKNQWYQLLPLSLSQKYGEMPELVWGNLPYDNLLSLYQSLISEGIAVFVTNSEVEGPTLEAAFNQLKNQFQLQVVTLDCNENCNLYSIAENPIPFPIELPSLPTTLTNKPETVINSEYSFLVYNHRFNLTEQLYAHNTTRLTQMLDPVLDQQADFMILSGDLTHKVDDSQVKIIQQNFLDIAPFPVLYQPGAYDEQTTKPFGSGTQYFRTKSELFILIDQGPDQELTTANKLLIYNLLLRLEKYPEIDTIFVSVPSAGWHSSIPGWEDFRSQLAQPETTHFDQAFTDYVVPKLSALSDKKVYIMSGNLKAQESPAVFFKSFGNITSIASSVNYAPGDVYTKVSVSPEHGVTFSPFSTSDKPLDPIESFTIENMPSELPQSHTSVDTNGTSSLTHIQSFIFSIVVATTVSILVAKMGQLQSLPKKFLNSYNKKTR